ncbi:hypothetical protein Pta02_56970 [Planobispora takensis]|uniref:Uncharacterized protein n=1 Tax=Planobispora takensis TaxID=1367882 RepID=A0A8J3SZT4_9ACTN|nr:hypothetical protein Pta02_56970 [Planobispora takensis]
MEDIPARATSDTARLTAATTIRLDRIFVRTPRSANQAGPARRPPDGEGPVGVRRRSIVDDMKMISWDTAPREADPPAGVEPRLRTWGPIRGIGL